MVFCNKCGEKLEENVRFCSSCGDKIIWPEDTENQQFNENESKSIFNSKFSKKLQKFGKETKKQFDNFDFDEFKQEASKTTEDTLNDLHDFVDDSTKKVNIKKAKTNFEKEKYEKTIEYCDRVLNEEFDEELYLLKAKAIFNLERHEYAINLILDKIPDIENIEYYLFLGDSYQKQFKLSKSFQFYDKALEMDENNFYAWYGKAYSYSKDRSYQLSCNSFSRADELGDLKDDDYYNWCLNLCNIRRYDEAFEVINKVEDINSSSKYVEKLELINLKRVLNSEDLEFIFEMAKTKFENYDWQTALIFLNRYIKIDDDNPEVWKLIVKCQYYLAQYNDALDSCINLISLDYNENNLNLKSEILIGLEKIEESIKTLKEALKLNPDYHLTYANLGFSYYFMYKFAAFGKETVLSASEAMQTARTYLNKSLNCKYNARAWAAKALIDNNFNIYSCQAVFRHSNDDDIERIAANLFISNELWHYTQRDLMSNYENLSAQRLLEKSVESFNESYTHFELAYNHLKKLNLSKDFWFTNIYFKLLEFHFFKITYFNFHNVFKLGQIYQIREFKDIWLKFGKSLFELYGNINYLIEQGKINMEFHEYEDAIADFNKAIELNDIHNDLMYNDLRSYKGLTYKNQMLGYEYGSKNYNKYARKSLKLFNSAIFGYEILLKKDPNNEDLLTRKAINLARTDRKAEAILIYQNMLDIDPNSSHALNGLKTIHNM